MTDDLVRAAAEGSIEHQWLSQPIGTLTTHISGRFHEYLRDELPVLTRQTAALASRWGDERVFHLRSLATLLRELRNEVDPHAWIEEDLLFPVLVAHESPAVLMTTLTPDRLQRLAAQLAEDHQRIRQVLARITDHEIAVTDRAADVPDWAALLVRVAQLRDRKLEEMDLEDRCVLPRALEFADARRQYRPYR